MSIEKISSRQLTWLIISMAMSTPTLMMPATVIHYAKQSAWLSLTIALILTTLGIWLNAYVAGNFPGQTVAQYAQTLLGKRIGMLIGIFYGLMTLFTSAFGIRSFCQLFQITIMPETPLYVFVLGIVCLTVYTAWQGLEPIARLNDIFLPVMVLSVSTILILALPQGRLYNLLPITQLEYAEIVKGSLVPFGYLSETSIILVIAFTLNKPQELKTSALKGIAIAGLLLILITQVIIFELGIHRGGAYLSPLLVIAQELLVLDFIERLEPLLLSAWITLMVVKSALFIYAFALCTSQALGRKSHSPLLLSSLIIVPALALLPKSLAEHRFIYVVTSFKYLAPLIIFVIPLILLITAKVKIRHG